jgi:DNA-binding CsgD family transcriptional regulator
MTNLEEGRAAQAREDWPAAKTAYERAVNEHPTGEAHQGLAEACFWLVESEASLAAMEKAYTAYREEGQPVKASWAALWICVHHLRVTGNPAAAAGWARRSERLLQDAEAEPRAELAKVILVRGLATQDWHEIESAADRAAEVARRFGDTDWELLAIAHGGLALIATGRVREGLGRLDEAMAGATGGEARAPDAVGQIFCVLMSGCERTVDLRRAEEWRRIAQPFIETYARHGFSGTCHAVYAGVLLSVGHWREAERELLQAVASFQAGAPAMRGDALVRLAGLRVRQGRLDEAEALLEGWHDHPDAQAPLAALEIARGRPRVAAALLERRVAQLASTDPQSAPLLLRVVEAHLAAGNRNAAADATSRLVGLAGQEIESLRGLAELAAGLTGGDEAALARALDLLTRAGLVYEACEVRLALAEKAAVANPDLAVREARTALATFSALGARPAADRAAGLLRRLGKAAPAGPRGGLLTRREQDVARLVALGLSNEQIATQLFLSERTVEHHVSSILRKLDKSKRTEIAAYAAREMQIPG